MQILLNNRLSIKKLFPLLFGFIFLLFYYLIYSRYIPNLYGTVGHDYRLNLPNLLSGYYWFLNNGFWSIPWLSPSQCGGSPFFPDINVMYFSIPQFLSFYISPIKAVRVTFFSFSLIGFIGFYYLMKESFNFTKVQATLGGLLFMFNGFFAYRMLIGHLTVHSYMLLPIIGLALLPSTSFLPKRSLLDRVFRLAVAGTCFSYMFYSGFIYGIPPVILSIIALILIASKDIKTACGPLLNLFLSLAIACCLSSIKLVGAFAVLSNFPRTLYPLPGYDSIARIAYIIINNIFFAVPNSDILKFFNSGNIQGRHEFENGLTVIPLFLITILILVKILQRRIRITTKAILLIFLCMIPVIFNWYEPSWNQFLKSIPLVKSSSTLIRWFCFYIPIVIVASLYGLKELCGLKLFNQYQLAIAIFLSAAFIFLNYSYDKFYYFEQPYHIAPIESAWEHANKNKSITPISFVDGDINNGNDSLIQGGSQINCYQPIFGYNLEKFPLLNLRPGNIYTVSGGKFNFKNPACYIFPSENKCHPGDHFTESDKSKLESLAEYRPVYFQKSRLQIFSAFLSLITLVFILSIMGLRAITFFKSKAKLLRS